MNRVHPFLLSIAVFTSGCTTASIHYIEESEFAAGLEPGGAIESAEVVMRTGERFKVKRLVAEGDSVRFEASRAVWSGGASGQQTVSLQTIRSITLTDHGEGAVEGLQRGATGGLIALGSAGAAYADGETEDALALVIVTVVALPFVVAASLIHGAAHGKKHRFEFGPEPEPVAAVDDPPNYVLEDVIRVTLDELIGGAHGGMSARQRTDVVRRSRSTSTRR